jgi:hypothetical protein
LNTSQRRGKSFEKIVGIYLKKIKPKGTVLYSNQWIAYLGKTGCSYAQPDHYIVFPTHILLIECKLTQNSSAFAQMGHLYAPLLRHIYELPVIGVQACKHLKTAPEKYLVHDLEELFEFSGEQLLHTWHGYGL